MTIQDLLADTMASWRRERPDLDLEVMGTVLRLSQLATLASRVIGEVFAPHGISLGEFDVLAALRRNGAGTALTPTVLARVSMISAGGMTNRLDRLEAAGLVARRPDPGDRRGSLIELTDRGRVTADQAVEALVAVEQEIFAVIDRGARRGLDVTLDALIASAELRLAEADT